MKSRHLAREIAFQFLYRIDGESLSPSAVENEVEKHFEHFKVHLDLHPFARDLILGTLRERLHLDQVIENRATKWKISRMPAVDRNLLRMACYELLHHPATPRSVVINEVIELAKEFGNEAAPSFINGILDAIAKSIPAKTT